MRFVIYGAGGVGGTIGARLFQQGHDVVLVARGEHGARLREEGLRFLAPEGEEHLRVPAVEHPSEVAWGAGDVVFLTMKSQDTAGALEALAAAAPASLPVVCAQNGVANERAVLRRFANVLGMCVILPATFLEPGSVEANGEPLSGILDFGRYPSGAGGAGEPAAGPAAAGAGAAGPAGPAREVAAEVAAALEGARFSSRAVEQVMRLKYRKLLSNLGNAVEALCGPDAARSDESAATLLQVVREEGEMCLVAAGIDVASAAEDAERRGDLVRVRPVAWRRRGGGSTWQSLQRGLSSVETDFLNGEIVLLGRLHGVPTPANELLQARMRAAVGAGVEAGSVSAASLVAELGLNGAG